MPRGLCKQILKECLPPFFLRWLKSIRGHPQSQGVNTWGKVYPDWESACAASGGYDQKAIFDKTLAAAREVLYGRALWERDSVLFSHEAYNLPLVAALMSAAAWNSGRLKVLDFGGSLGCVYRQHRPLLQKLNALSWVVVEQPHLVAAGREEFCDGVLDFALSMEEAAAGGPVDVVLFSGSLQYVGQPYALLEQAVTLAAGAVIIDRTAFAEEGERITVQQVPPEIYAASYPCRWLDKTRVSETLSRNMRQTPWWQSAVDSTPGFLGVMAYRESDNPGGTR